MAALDRRRVLGAATVGATLAGACAASPDGRSAQSSAMLQILGAPGPHVVAGEPAGARAFDGVIGDWAVLYTFIAADGSRQQAEGRFIADWVLDGRAVQDLWIGVPPGASERWIGTTLRFFDAERGRWRVVWVSPFANAVTLLEGAREGDRIALHGQSASGAVRWIFYDLAKDSFSWRGEVSVDGGATWRVREDHRMRRKA